MSSSPIEWSQLRPLLLAMGLVLVGAFYVFDGAVALLAAGVVYAMYWVVWFVRSIATEYSWKYAADELGWRYSGFEGIPESIVPLVPRLRIDREDGGEASIYLDASRGQMQTVWEADCSEMLPSWLTVTPGATAATADRWLDIEDVKLGQEELDSRAIVGGASAVEVRRFMWEGGFDEELAELYEAYEPFEIQDGKVRLLASGIVRSAEPLREKAEELESLEEALRDVLAGNLGDEEGVKLDGEESQAEVAEEEHEAAVRSWGDRRD